MARARGTPAGALSTSKPIAPAPSATPRPAPPETSAAPATPAPLTAAPVCSGCHNHHTLLWALSQPLQKAPGAVSWLAPAGAGVAGGEADGVLGPVQQFLAQRGRHQHARLVLEDPGVERGKDGPDPRLV